MHRAGWLVVVAIGCSTSPPGGAIDAGSAADGAVPVDVSPAVLHVHAHVGATIVSPDGQIQEAAEGVGLAVFLSDGSQPTVTPTGDGSIDFQRAAVDQTYVIVDETLLIEGDTSALNYLPDVFGHSELVPVTAPSELAVTLAHAGISGGHTTLLATGQRSVLQDASDPFTFSVDWGDAQLLAGGPPGLLDASEGDTLWFVHTATGGSGQTSIDAAGSASLMQSDGSASAVGVTLAAPSVTGCVRVTSSVTAESARFAAAVPSASAVAAAVAIESEPDAAHAIGGEYTIATAPAGSDGAIDVAYGEPFPGEGLLAAMQLALPTAHHAGATALAPEATLTSELPLASTANTCDALSIIALPVGPAVATGITIGGTALAADNQSFSALGAATVAVTASSGGADRYTLSLLDVTSGAATVVATLVSAHPTFLIDATLFTHAHVYELATRIETGILGTATGDLSTPTMPYAASTVPSFTFTMN